MTHGIFIADKASDVATRPRQALDKAGADRIGDGREHDRNGAGHLPQGRHCVAGRSQDNVRLERDQFPRVFAHKVRIQSAPAGVDADIAAVGPAQLLQSLQERRQIGLISLVV